MPARAPEDHADLLVRHLVGEVIDGHLSQVFGYALEEVADERTHFGRRRGAVPMSGGLSREQPRARATVAEQVEAGVRRRRIEPRRRRGIGAKLRRRSEQGHEHVVHDLPRVVLVAQQAPRAPEDEMPVAPVQVLDEGRVQDGSRLSMGKPTWLRSSWHRPG